MSKGLLAVILFASTYTFAAVAKPALTKKQHDALVKKAKAVKAVPRSCSEVRWHMKKKCREAAK